VTPSRDPLGTRILDRPLAFDTAVSLEAAAIKKLSSRIAGEADILIVPDLESGNRPSSSNS
jgi:phosphate acetyltransferase